MKDALRELDNKNFNRDLKLIKIAKYECFDKFADSCMKYLKTYGQLSPKQRNALERIRDHDMDDYDYGGEDEEYMPFDSDFGTIPRLIPNFDY